MARAFWKGSVSFGLIDIPVSLHSAVTSDDLDLTLLDRRDFAPVGYQRYNKRTGKQVDWEQIVRGYEHEPEEYVVLTDEDLKRANVEATRTIEVLEFVEREAIEPLFYDTPYYVAPARKGSKSYRLLRDALRESKRVAVAHVVLRTRQHLAALLVHEDLLVLDLMRYPHEIRKPASLQRTEEKGGTTAVTPQERRMAQRLIDEMTVAWEPDKYHDAYRDDLMALIRRRVRARRTHVIEEAPAPKPKRRSEVVDLMPLLEESLDQAASASVRARGRGPTRAAPGRRRRKSA